MSTPSPEAGESLSFLSSPDTRYVCSCTPSKCPSLISPHSIRPSGCRQGRQGRPQGDRVQGWRPCRSWCTRCVCTSHSKLFRRRVAHSRSRFAVGSCYDCKACNTGQENYCPKGVDTYNAKYENGDLAHGGYSSGIRVHERFVFALPEGLSDEDAAPMLCGGLTVYAPLKRFGTGPGKKVAIAGIGGLGHFAVQVSFERKGLGYSCFANIRSKSLVRRCPRS